MEDAFKKLEADGKNTVEELTAWLQHAKLIEESKVDETKKKLGGTGNVTLQKFKEVVEAIAKEKKAKLSEIHKILTDTKEFFTSAVAAVGGAGKAALGAFGVGKGKGGEASADPPK